MDNYIKWSCFLQETEREIEMYKSQYANIQRKKLQITDEHVPLVNEIEDIQQRLDALSSEAESLGVSWEKQLEWQVYNLKLYY